MTSPRKRPQRIELVADLFKTENQAEDYVPVKGKHADLENKRPSSSSTAEVSLTLAGRVKIRREVKGRAGKPVTVLFDFSDPNAKHPQLLRALQSVLKERLACGGTFDSHDHTIVLQVDDLLRVRLALEKLGFDVKG